uniref:Uncharacterized protein n=1 Tax=Biomphalaria glabrata TaxID=6526 RepID=A0A2C9LWI4_BIOGL
MNVPHVTQGGSYHPVILFALTFILGLMTSFPLVAANLDYTCVFGTLSRTRLTDGSTLEYCQTGMEPPVVLKDDFVEARSQSGQCWECMCDDETGLACCTCGRQHRGG